MSKALDTGARAEAVLTSLTSTVRVLQEAGEGHA